MDFQFFYKQCDMKLGKNNLKFFIIFPQHYYIMEPNFLFCLFIILGAYLIIDIPVITVANEAMYRLQFTRINQSDSPGKLTIFLAASLTYLLLALGACMFVVRPGLINNQGTGHIFANGLILGLVIYGVYNGTNLATIKQWGLKESSIDTAWGTLLTGIVSIASVGMIKILAIDPNN